MRSNLFTEKEKEETNSTRVFGLDLGTTNSVVTAKVSEGLPQVLKSDSGETTPSCVMFNDDGTYTIGNDAYTKRHKGNVVYSFKKYMGTDTKMYKDYTPRNIASMFVKNLLEEVKKNNPEFSNYFSVQVSVPAYFDMNQIEDTKMAIEDAGYRVVGVNDEPTAAAILYQQTKRVTDDILVFDLGGGTFDAVLIRNIPGIPKDSKEFYEHLEVEVPQSESVLEILDISGDNQLGGDDIDVLAAELYIKEHKLKLNKEEKEKLILVAENVKKYGFPVTPEVHDQLFKYSYVEEATKQIIDKCFDIMNAMMNRAKVFNVNCVPCGGSTKSKVVQDELAKRFHISADIDPDLAVGVGNSIKYYMDATDSGLSVVSRLAKGVGVLANDKVKYLAEKGSVIPLRSKFVARNSEPFGEFVNIDLYQGDVFTGENTHVSTLTLKNITGHDKEGYAKIGIELLINSEGTMSVTVNSGSAVASTNLVLSETDEPQEDVNIDIHPEAKFYTRFKKASGHYQDDELTSLVDEYKVTGDKDTAKMIMQRMGQLAN